MSSGSIDSKLDKLLDSIKDLIYVVEKRESKDDTHYSFRHGSNGIGENPFLNRRNTINSTDYDNLMNDVMKSLKDNLKQFNEDLRRINKELATTTDSTRKKVLQEEKAKKKKNIRKVKERIKEGPEAEYARRNIAAQGQLTHEYNISTDEVKQRYGSAENYVKYKQGQSEYLQSTQNRNDARRMIYEGGLGDTIFGRYSKSAIDRQQKAADLGNFSQSMKYGGSEKMASAMFGKGKMSVIAAKGLGGLGKAAGIASKALARLAGPIGIIIDILGMLGDAAKAVADADAKQQEIQNKRNTTLTNRNIELSNIETEGMTDTISTFGENALSQYNMLFTKTAGNLQVDIAKTMAGIQTATESAIGDANKAAWNAFNAQVDIEKQQKDVAADIKKTSEIEGRNITQRNSELEGRNIERSYQSENAILQADIENSRLNMEDKRYTYEHPYATTANRAIGKVYDGATGGKGSGSTVADNVKGNNKWNEKYGQNNNRFASDSVAGYAAAGAVNSIPIVGGVTKNFGEAYLTKQNTVMERGITDATNSFNAMSAAAKNQIQINNQVLSTTNQVQNTVSEGVNEITKTANDASAQITKAYGAMAQSVEEYFKQFQKNAFNTGIGQNITDRKQLDSYFKNLMTISSNVSEKYGVTSEEVMRMQQDYNAGGRNKMLSEKDYNAQAALGKELLGGDFGTAAELSNNTEIFNMGVEQTVELTGEMYKQVNKMGLDGRKYIKDLAKNLKAAQKYDFKNGVKGLMNMAAKAQNIRFNMDSLGGILDDIQGGGLENLITKGAKLQVMGGRFAMNANPIAMMYEAFSDPEALMSRYNDMLTGMGRMNSKTGKVDFTGEEQMMLRNFAQITGQNLEDVRAQATYKVKKDKVEPSITDKNLSEEQRASLVNKAFKGEDGQWKVNDIYGNEMNLSDVNSNNIKNVEASTYEGKMEEGMQHIVAFTDQFIGQTDSNNALIAQKADENNKLTSNFQERLEEQRNDVLENLQKYADKVNEMSDKATEAYKDFLKQFESSDPMESVTKATNEATAAIQNFAKDTKSQLDSILTEMGGTTQQAKENMELGEKLKGITTGGGKYNLQELANQGIVKNGGNGTLIVDKDLLKRSYNTEQLGLGNWSRGKLRGAGFNDVKYEDGLMSANGNPILSQASHITPINDGSIKLAQSDPGDSAIFAKQGGPFDTLFNGVFNRVDKLYDAVMPNANTGITEPMAEPSYAQREQGGPFDTQTIKFDTLKVEMSGKLELSSGGQSVDVMSELQNNPTLIRSLSQMLTQHVSAAMNGGRGKQSLSYGSV